MTDICRECHWYDYDSYLKPGVETFGWEPEYDDYVYYELCYHPRIAEDEISILRARETGQCPGFMPAAPCTKCFWYVCNSRMTRILGTEVFVGKCHQPVGGDEINPTNARRLGTCKGMK